MKKIGFILLIMVLCLSFAQAYRVKFVSGEENAKLPKKVKPIYVYLTTNNIHIWNKELGSWINNQNAEGSEFNKEEMIIEFKEKFTKAAERGGRKWKLKVINDMNKAKDGYVIHLNLSQVIPTPMVSLHARSTIKIYKSDDKGTMLVKARLRATEVGNKFYPPGGALRIAGDLLGNHLLSFIADCEKGKGKFRYIPEDKVDDIAPTYAD